MDSIRKEAFNRKRKILYGPLNKDLKKKSEGVLGG